MSNKTDATFHGEELPRRTPFETLASFDRTAKPEEYSPGRPPWAPERNIGPRWVWVLGGAALGLVLMSILMSFLMSFR